MSSDSRGKSGFPLQKSWDVVPLKAWLTLHCPLNFTFTVPQELHKVFVVQWADSAERNQSLKRQQPRATRTSQYRSIGELVDRAVYEILESWKSSRPQHALVLGYRRERQGSRGTPLLKQDPVNSHGMR